MTISDDYAAELVAKMRADTQRTDEIGATIPADPRDLLILKLWDRLKALEKGTAHIWGGIRPTRVSDG